MTHSEYWNAIADMVKDARDAEASWEEGHEFDLYDYLWAEVASHQYVIYTANNLAVLPHSGNSEALFEMGTELPDNYSQLLASLAFAAMIADVSAEYDH